MRHPEKQALRRRYRAARAALSSDARAAASAAAVRRLIDSGRLEGATIVASYAAIDDEIDPIHLESIPHLSIAYPRVESDGLHFFVASHADLEPRTMKIPEPRNGREVALDDIDVFVVPGLAFGPDGRRLGFGGGYYDRALVGRQARAIGLAYDEQIAEALPLEAHDIRMSAVVTPTRMFLAEASP